MWIALPRALRGEQIASCLLTVLSGGLFIRFWFLAIMLGWARAYKCQVCGTKN